PRKEPAVERLESQIRDKADEADDDDAEDDLPGSEPRLAVDDHVADARRRAYQFRDDDIGPCPAEHEAQRLGDLRRIGRYDDALDDTVIGGTKRIGRLHKVTSGIADGYRDDQDEL